ncbi:unnamed protein product [Cyprideis torosa]|uniref:Uncharacterized protein n=1 Tax=Cyprideis torosa TaxID=163714 RepID=A0A7R8W5H9_9CRUS|nr:unnamed protein product [Cyprideis torosa]CAG0885293.1 unnamed protein product [Cyprideis torosa]
MYMSPHVIMGVHVETSGLRVFPSFQPMILANLYNDRMNFWERLYNTVFYHSFFAFWEYNYFPWVDEFLTQNNGGRELHVKDLLKNASLYISNADLASEPPSPMIPNIIHAGGMHCRPAKPVPKKLESWIQKGNQGFIYFSLGSTVKGADMPENFRRMFIAVFKRFSEYQIFWKWETEHMDDLPSNVMLSKWMPQQDLLGHSDCKLFITHGGLLSTQEATYHGVPVVGIGIGIDQMTNMKKTESMGAGIALEWNKLTVDQLVSAIERVLRDRR